jgi:hypothetical protein
LSSLAHMFENCRGGCDDELMTGNNRGETAAAHEAVADARREAAAALARLAGAAVRYADARITEETAAVATAGLPRIKRAKPGEFVADELAVMLRDCFPTCAVPAERCDLDHHEPAPRGPTSGTNMDPFCRRHHRGKTFAWKACTRDDHGVGWTMPDAEACRCLDEPLPTGRAA